MRLRRYLAVYAGVGPLFGCFAFFALSFASIDAGPLANRLIATVTFGVWGLLLAYPIGLLPAIGAGVTHWLLLTGFGVRSNHLGLQALLGASIGFAISAFGGVVYLWGHPDFSLHTIWSWLAFPGAVSGALCSVLVQDSADSVRQQPLGNDGSP